MHGYSGNSGSVVIEPLTRDHMAEWYPDLKYSVRGFAAVENGKVLGLCGVYYPNTNQVVFAKFTDEIKQRKRVLLKLLKTGMQLLGPLSFVVCDPVPGAETLLRHFGFHKYKGDVWAQQLHR